MTQPCGQWNGAAATHCGATPARHYLPGWRCAAHTPAALAGQPEPGQSAYCAPARCYCGEHPWWTPDTTYTAIAVESWTTDARAIASGKRRASPSVQAAAKQTVADQQARETRLRRST
ncbi:hypothetical protein MF672_038980 [Actinomadura sp. ATCC 31491]|uniref:Uncharacterized protein n=1 Tax=Actinomadura luzonensis TaxID=2805427 RepID=A0ABT0G552_9ACTN|nr:hypothetical protein [Actinomadura luzonensis]MCK2219739.1 hypothetical protein [Actinomadura luzonensis]